MDDARLYCLQQGQRDVVKGLSLEIKMDEARFCLAFSRPEQGQRDAGIRCFSPVKGLSHEIKMDDASPVMPSAGTARCWDQVFFSCKRTIS